jgi:hypothetical protein
MKRYNSSEDTSPSTIVKGTAHVVARPASPEQQLEHDDVLQDFLTGFDAGDCCRSANGDVLTQLYHWITLWRYNSSVMKMH